MKERNSYKHTNLLLWRKSFTSDISGKAWILKKRKLETHINMQISYLGENPLITTYLVKPGFLKKKIIKKRNIEKKNHFRRQETVLLPKYISSWEMFRFMS